MGVVACSCRHFSSATRRVPRLEPHKIRTKYKRQAITDSRRALIDYLHSTRVIPYHYAENIARNSPFHLFTILSRLQLSHPTVSASFRKFLMYHPINEHDFFLESIGINPSKIPNFFSKNTLSFLDGFQGFDSACALSNFGFPWKMLGALYMEEFAIFSTSPNDLNLRLSEIKSMGFSSTLVISICLSFPFLLRSDSEPASDIYGLLADLKILFIDFCLSSCIPQNVEDCSQICRKIRVFYKTGCEMGKSGDLLAKNMDMLLHYPEEELCKKADFFCKLFSKNKNVGWLLLEKPAILNIELGTRPMSVAGFLKYFGLNKESIDSLYHNFPHVFGRNLMENTPNVIRVLGLQEWLFDKIQKEDHLLLSSYSIGDAREDVDGSFMASVGRLCFTRTPVHTSSKLNFLHRIGFGENSVTIRVLSKLQGTHTELQERFDYLLSVGFEFSQLVRMVALTPDILNQNVQLLRQKTEFFLKDMAMSLDEIYIFPSCFFFDLNNRIRPRYMFHMWLLESGYHKKSYSISTIIATGERNFMSRIFKIHPALPKQWFERFYCKNIK